MLRPLFLTRASIGLAATAAEGVLALPGRTVETVVALPGLPVKLAGNLVQSYLHAGQALTDLAIKGDRVLAAVFPARADHPEWATFDEDMEEGEPTRGETGSESSGSSGYPGGSGGSGDSRGSDVPIGRVTPRDA